MRRLLHIPHLVLAALATSLVVASTASAEEVTLALYAEGEYNSNILGRSTNEIDSFVSHIGPQLTIEDPYGRFTYDLTYRGDFVWYANANNLDSYDQFVDAEIAYALSQTTTFTAYDSFRDQSNIRFSIDEEDDLADTLDGGRDKFLRNIFKAQLEHSFTRRLSGLLKIDNQVLDYEDKLRNTDSSFMGATGSLSYALSAEDSIGLGASFTYQSYEASLNTFGSRGQIWDTFLSWVHVFESDMKFSIQGGPSWVKTIGSDKVFANEFLVFRTTPGGPTFGVQDPCLTASPDIPGAFLESSCTPVLVVGSSPRTTLPLIGVDPKDNDLTFFGSASLVKNWENWEFRASYLRQESGASGDDGTSALDRVLLNVNWDADRLWSFYGSAIWSRRKRIGGNPRIIQDFIVTASPGSGPARRIAAATTVGSRNGSENNQVSVILGSRRRLTKHLNAEATFRYRYAIRERQTVNSRNDQYFIFGVRLQYVFDPVRL